MQYKCKNRTLYIHIGYPKTASSTLQNFLYNNREVLYKQSILYPTPIFGAALSSLKHQAHLAMSPSASLIFPDAMPWTYYAEYFSNMIKSSDVETAIISAESFVGEDPNIFRQYFPGYNIKIICYFRSYFSYLSSIYKQFAKEGLRQEVFKIKWTQFPLQRIEEYLQVFGATNCIFKNFDTLKNAGNLIYDFMDTVGIVFTDDIVSPRNINITPHDAATMFLYQLSFLPIPYYTFIKLSFEVQAIDLSLYDDFRCTLLPKEVYHLDENIINQIRRQGELLQDSTWLDFCMTQKVQYESIVDNELPQDIQQYIFRQLSNESQQAIIKYYTNFDITDTQKPILHSIYRIQHQYFEMLTTLRESFIQEHKTVLLLNSNIENLERTIQHNLYLTQQETILRINYITSLQFTYCKIIIEIIIIVLSSLISQKSREILFIYFSGCFDTLWYLSTYSYAYDAKLNLIKHYINHGANEKKHPAPWFNTAHYLSVYTDVADSGLNPFYHYLRYGCKEGRQPQ